MADQPAGNGTPGATDPQPQGQAPTSPAVQATGTDTPQTNTDGKFSSDEAERIIADLRKEAAASRKRLQEFEAAQKAADDAKLSEQEKLTKALAEHQAQAADLALKLQQARLQVAVRDHAAALGITDPALALVALQTEHAHELEPDDDGNFTNVDKLLAQVVKNHPALAAQPQTQQRPAQPPTSSGGAASPSRSQTAAQPQPRDLKTQPIRRLSDIWPGR